MQIITIAGNIGRDAETRQAGSGTVTNFSVGVNDRDKNTTWYKCAMWGQRGEKLAAYLTKGGKVTVVGSLTAGVYDGKPDMKVNVSEVTLHGGGQLSERREPVGRAPSFEDDLSDNVPF
jgi:single-strand DNA-binding protein